MTNQQDSQSNQSVVIPGDHAEPLLRDIANWGPVTTIVLHLGSVFEFKGDFPKGSDGFGFYNLEGPVPGFHGHLKLDSVDHISFQEKQHRGRESFALVFNTAENKTVFKIFLGRDENGEVISSQLKKFHSLKDLHG